jgi:hypothetical protein
VEDAIGAEEEAAGAEEAPLAAAEEDELELHAAVDRARPAMPVRARRRYFTVLLLERFRCL